MLICQFVCCAAFSIQVEIAMFAKQVSRYIRGLFAFFCFWISSATNALEAEDISRWVEATPKIQQWMERQSDRLQGYRALPERQASLADVYEQGIDQLKMAGLYPEFDAVLKATGYRDSAHWVADSTHIHRSLVAIASLPPEQLSQSMELKFDSMNHSLENSASQEPLSDSSGTSADKSPEQVFIRSSDSFSSEQRPIKSLIQEELAELDLRIKLLPEEKQAFQKLLRWKEDISELVADVPTTDILLVRRYWASIYRVLN